MLAPLTFARLPTPVQRLPRLSEAWGIDLWCKRDDLTGAALSGNKVRKLDWLAADAVAKGADVLVTTGGAQSNHARAAAVVARRLGMEPCLLLRGPQPADLDGNLLLDRLLGATVRFYDAGIGRAERDGLLEGWVEALRASGRRPYLIPEGGSNGLGVRAFQAAAQELASQADPFDHVVVAVGSGGTVAGLASGGLPGMVQGVAVCDDRATFEAIAQRIGAEAAALGGAPLPPPGSGWQIVEGYQGPAYAVATPEVWATIREAAALEGLICDPVYTGKALHALRCEALAGRWLGRVLFWHTGGIFGLFGRGGEIG